MSTKEPRTVLGPDDWTESMTSAAVDLINLRELRAAAKKVTDGWLANGVLINPTVIHDLEMALAVVDAKLPVQRAIVQPSPDFIAGVEYAAKVCESLADEYEAEVDRMDNMDGEQDAAEQDEAAVMTSVARECQNRLLRRVEIAKLEGRVVPLEKTQ